MNLSFGGWMLTGGTRDERHEEARQREHLAMFREAQVERRAARHRERSTALSNALGDLRARFTGRPAEITRDCCPA